MAYNQGDIVLVPFPFTNQQGDVLRPALVISNNEINRTSDILLVQITKNDRLDNFSVRLKASDLTVPLRFTSEVRCHKLLLADKGLIKKKISELNIEVVKQVSAKICNFVKVP